MSDSDEDDDASELSFADPNAAAAAAEQALLDEPSEDEDDAPAKKKQKQKAAKQKAKANKNAPLDEDGKPMIWDADEGGWVRDVGFTEGPEALTEQWIQTRLSQTLMHLEKLLKGGGMHGTSLINHDEMNYCREVLNHALAACLSDLAGAKEKATASSVFWAIALAQNAAAGRPGGWVVDSRSAIDTWSMDTLHAYIENFKGEGTKVDESGSIGGGGPATRIQQAKGGGGGRGRGRGRGQFSGAQGGSEALKRRRLRFDALGDNPARREKLKALNELILAGGGSGLQPEILNLQPPSLRQFAQPPAADTDGNGSTATLPGVVANPAGRLSARQAMLARYGQAAMRKTAERVAGGETAVLTSSGSTTRKLRTDSDDEEEEEEEELNSDDDEDAPVVKREPHETRGGGAAATAAAAAQLPQAAPAADLVTVHLSGCTNGCGIQLDPQKVPGYEYVDGCVDGSAAALASAGGGGFKVGDLLLSVDGEQLTGRSLRAVMKPADAHVFVVSRLKAAAPTAVKQESQAEEDEDLDALLGD